nr:uncharacterized protein LOC111509644 [Leptinotarsa decemlineata]
MYYVSTERDQVRASQSLDTVPEKESKSSMDSKNALESKENIRSVEDEKLEPKSKHSIQKNMEDEQELKSFTIVPSKESFRLSTKNLVNVNDEHDENSSKHILTSHRTDESTHDTESPSEEKQQKKSRESIISSMVSGHGRVVPITGF